MSVIFKSQAGVIDHTPSGDVEAGAVVQVGGIVGVATRKINANERGSLRTDGVFDLPLAESESFTAGDPVYVDNSEAADSGTFFGYAIADSADGHVAAELIQSPPDNGS